MPSRVLPSRPSLDKLKRQARELRKSYLDGDDLIRSVVEPYRSLFSGEAGGFTLTDAKLVLAREYDFDSWPKLKHHVESSRGDYAQVDDFMNLVREGNTDRAWFVEVHGFAPWVLRSDIQIGVHAAARLDLLERLMSLLDEDPERAHQLDEAGLTPLHVAATIRIRVLLVHNYSANPEARDTACGATPAQWATLDRPEVARGFVSGGVQTDVVMLCALDLVEEVKDALLDAPGLKDKLDLEDLPGGKVYARALAQRTTLLHAAAYFGSERVARLLLEEGTDLEAIDSTGATALHQAAGRGQAGLVALLLERGASPESTDGNGIAALDVAITQGVIREVHFRRDYVGVVDALVRAGASVERVKLPTGREDLDAVLTKAADDPQAPR